MSEVIDRPPVFDAVEKLEATKPPHLYRIEAWSGGYVCRAKFVIVSMEVFQIPPDIANILAKEFDYCRRVTVALNLTREVAEMKADKATKQLADLVGDCSCGHRLKFMPIRSD